MDFKAELLPSNSSLEDRVSNPTNVFNSDLEQGCMEMASLIHEPSLSSTEEFASIFRSESTDCNVATVILHHYGKHHRTLYVTFLLFILLLIYTISEWNGISAGSDPNLTTDLIKVLNDRNTTEAYFGAQSLNINDSVRTRVVYFILDGLRFDATLTNPSLNALTTLPWFARDSLILNMSAQLPTISIPNWQSLVTGARPSLHGRTGNDILTPFTFDSIFTSSMSVGMKNGVTGDAWWSSILNGHLTPFYGDGTSPTYTNDFDDEVYTHGHSDYNKDLAYNQRFHEAIKSQTIKKQSNGSNVIVQFDYDLFLSYYDDIDAKSHAFSPQSSQVQSAIDDKVAFVRTGIDTICALDTIQQTRTIFIVTSDHGHVNVGGHGGDVSVLRTVPCIIYANNSQLASIKNSLPVYTTFDSIDIATSITALLGIPTPRQSEGTFISPLISALVSPSKWIHLYFDLFKQKQALASALLTQWSQSALKSQYASLFGNNTGLNDDVASLNSKIETLSTLIQTSKARHVAYITTGNVIFSLIMAIFSIVMVCIIFHQSTFIDLRIILPTVVVWIWTQGWRRSLYNCCQTVNIEKYSKSMPLNIQQLHWIFLLFSVVIIGAWWSFMMIALLVVFADGYRPTAEWRWQFTLFNSLYDKYVLIIGICIVGSCVVTGLITLILWLIFRLKTITIRLSKFFDLLAFN